MDGPASWFGTLVQGGSFALIAYLIVYQWPRAIERLVKSHDDSVSVFKVVYDKAVETFDKDLREMAASAGKRHDDLVRVFQDEQKFERANCDHAHKELMTVIDKNYQALSDSIRTTRHEIRGHLQTVMNSLEIGRITRKRPSGLLPDTEDQPPK